MREEAIELIHALQAEQIELNSRITSRWVAVGELLSEMLENNRKMLAILEDEAGRLDSEHHGREEK